MVKYYITDSFRQFAKALKARARVPCVSSCLTCLLPQVLFASRTSCSSCSRTSRAPCSLCSKCSHASHASRSSFSRASRASFPTYCRVSRALAPYMSLVTLALRPSFQYHLSCSCFPMLHVTFSYLFPTRELSLRNLLHLIKIISRYHFEVTVSINQQYDVFELYLEK